MNQQVTASLALHHHCSCKRDSEKYALLKVLSCPRCGQPGSLHEKWVLNKLKKRYHYYYVAHYLPSYKVRWCYCPKDTATTMRIQAQLSTKLRVSVGTDSFSEEHESLPNTEDI